MCGIAGILLDQERARALGGGFEQRLLRLRDRLGHRGPDDSAIERVGGAGLAHTRLAILDLTQAGAQPMWTERRDRVLVYNGEIYNHADLREKLEQEGHRFRGRSDTEVLLQWMSSRGEEGLAELDGMFAFGLLDADTEEVFLARDVMGQKPLYYASLEGGGWAFSSEIMALLALPEVSNEIDPLGLFHLLTFGFLPAPFSLRKSIRQLLPGEWLRLRARGEPERGTFAPAPAPHPVPLACGLEESSEALMSAISSSVRRHLVADVPVGILLSGGVDSSIVAALAASHESEIETFSVVHEHKEYDERDAARKVAEFIGSRHHEIELSRSPLREEELDRLVDHHGDPFADSSSLAVLRLSEAMRNNVSVALSGDGGDELFAGYPRFAQLRWLNRLARWPRAMLVAGKGLCLVSPGQRARQAGRALHVAAMPESHRSVAFKTFFWPWEQSYILREEWRVDAGELEQLLENRGWPAEEDRIASAHWLEQRLILPDEMLTKVDRMSMAVSLEVRPPLLGKPVRELAARLPFEMKLKSGEGKSILKRIARRLVPAEVVDRPKKGFAVPLSSHGGRVFEDAWGFAVGSEQSPLRRIFLPEALRSLERSLAAAGEGVDPEDSPYRRVHRRWLLTLLARALSRHGGL